MKGVHVLSHYRFGSVAVCGATLGEEIICGLERIDNDDMVSEDVSIYDIAWIERVSQVPS